MRRSRNHEAAEEFGASNAGLEDATPHEEMMLLAASGVTILQLDAALGGEQAVQGISPSHPPDRAAIENVRARVRRRRRLGLPHVDCLAPDCACGSLASALDELDEDATKAKIQQTARKLHRDRNPVFAPPRIPPVQSEPPVARDKPAAPPAPPAEVLTNTPTRPFRVVKRTKRWWDGPPGSGGIMDRVF
jgi:hypothetical protein